MRLIILIMGAISGPGLALYLTARVSHRVINSTARAEAEVTGVRAVKSGDSTSYCPMLSWSHDGKTYTAESYYCGDYDDEFEPGQKLNVRYDPEDRNSVLPDDFAKAYEDALIGYPAALFFSILFAWQMVTLRRRRG